MQIIDYQPVQVNSIASMDRQRLIDNIVGVAKAGCAFGMPIVHSTVNDMHSKDARSEGETEQRLYALTSWRETPFSTARERAALAWAEALTLITKGHVPDDIYELAKQSFSDEELVNLTLAVITINGWNRLAISFRSVPGAYQPGMHSRETSK